MGDGREVQKGGDMCLPMADFMLRFDRKQQNSVNNYASIKKNLKKNLQKKEGKIVYHTWEMIKLI